MNKDETEKQEVEKKEKLGSKRKVDSSRNSHLQRNCSEETLKNGKKQPSRRRKGSAKPRRIQPNESKLDGRKEKSLDSVLKRVLKAKQSEDRTTTEKSSKMIEIHETLPMHPHISKTVPSSSSPPGSVESPNSVYSNERPEEQMSERPPSSNVEPFVKVRPQSNGDISPELAPTHEELQRSFSSDAALHKASVSSMQRFVKEARDAAEAGRPSPPSLSPNNSSALVAMAAMGLPTMIQSNGMISGSIPSLIAMQQYGRRESFQNEEKKRFDISPKDRRDSYPSNGRGIPSIPNGLSLPNSNVSPPPSAEMRAQYKRPPHTYPALIASAILDSPGHLITLRGIYDYIMNNFPYYKYCHDKSAWQNSIRHNLSLNQCFVKVPRYENAAKSNYWTMTREGFEEFGNENSFKRRRRRGAALAPISAYKSKKYQNDGAKIGGKNKNENKNRPTANGATVPRSEDDYVMPLPSQLMGLAAAWGPGFRQADESHLKGRKRSLSPQGQEGAKQAKLMILQQGDGRTLGDAGKRPNSADEIQGAFSSFSKAPSQLLSSNFQSWAPKNLLSAGLLPKVDRTSPENHTQSNSEEIFNNGSTPVMIDGVEVGSEVRLRSDSASGLPVSHYRCGFCSYAYVSASGIVLEQHVRMLHQLEMTNAKAKAVAAAAMAKTHEALSEKSSDASKRLMLQNLMSGLSSASMMAAAQSNNLLATQASVGNTGAGFPYSGSFSSGLLSDSIIRSMAEQTATSQSSVLAGDRGLSNVEALAYQRQQALNNVLQQAAAAAVSTSSSQEQLRSLYQQVVMQNPFLANSGVFPRQVSLPESEESNQLKQQLWQYQQQFFNQMKAMSEDRKSPSTQTNADQERSSPRKSPSSYSDVENDLKRSIHGWKQCTKCSFTAKGDHGLELHYRKAHADGGQKSPLNMGPSSLNETEDSLISRELSACENKFNQRSESPLVSSAFPTPPLSNSPAYTKRHFVPLDLSAAKEDSSITASASTQTPDAELPKKRTCDHCDIVFGDEMMHALHMSCHDAEDPFKCKVCGQKCNERYYFNVHLLRGLHQNGPAALVPDSSFDAPVADDVPRCPSNGSDVASGYDVGACQE